MNKSKVLGQVYTPQWIVNEILNEVSYKGTSILRKYILEPSCGDGAFLCEIVKRYIYEAKKEKFSTKEIVDGLGTYIFGVEIDKMEYKKCVENLNQVVKTNLSDEIEINWQIFNENTLCFYQKYLNFFDFVVGNPPYIRIHNLDLDTREFLKKKFQFCTGTIDIYLAFFEIGFRVLKSDGRLGYITPNSFLHNTSYKDFRKFLKLQKGIKTLVDFKANKVFQGFSTYTAITIIDKATQNKDFSYKELVNEEIVFLNSVKFKNLDDKKWVFSNKENEFFLKELFENKNAALKDFFDVQYGFATLRDKIFISDIQDIDENYCYFNNEKVEKSLLKKIVKGSRYKGDRNDFAWILFPYEKQGSRFVVIPEDKIAKNYPFTYAYLLKNKEELEKRDMDKGALWYEFGRSQGIQSIHQEKIVLSTLVNGSVNFYRLTEDVLVYSGIFIVKNKEFSDWEMIENVLKSDDFHRYIRIMGKDFSGGYKSITTKQIKEYRIKTEISHQLF